MRCILVHYHELALKGRNRPFFEQRLVRNLRLALRDIPAIQVDALQGRIRIRLEPDTSWPEMQERVRRVFGVANFALAHGVRFGDDPERLLEPLKTAVGEAVDGLSFQRFRVSTKRSDKRLPITSMDVDRAVGAHVCALTGKAVDLRHPDLTIFIETLHKDAYYSVSRESGPGGLPVGTAGNIACLLSGGIDSPVAAYRMMKRGCKTVFIHFHGRPYVSRASEEKVRDIVETLTRYQSYSRLFLVPFGDIQRQIVLGAPAPLRIVLYRRMMVRIAEELARRERCWGLVTGDSLGQVASQTPQNLTAVEDAATLPILRPLIGMDKIEITEQAQRIGTFHTSIEPDQDCCRLFVPPHPTTRAETDQVRKVERGLDVDGLTKQGLERLELAEFEWPVRRVPHDSTPSSEL
ncbi:MAG TPA: tRNA uracil 4-sulfurtransferase ThiI [Nitrospiraceae bacterium]|jgi:tRNA uracil 4-sulfurtransferase|nr:tRNA uracil 4-sulfurtransferase ThiI [Nitrospiraceae bacterium]